MELPINQKDLNTILSALALGGDARLYHLLKDFKKDIDLNNEDYRIDTGSTKVRVFSESDDYQCKQGTCDI